MQREGKYDEKRKRRKRGEEEVGRTINQTSF